MILVLILFLLCGCVEYTTPIEYSQHIPDVSIEEIDRLLEKYEISEVKKPKSTRKAKDKNGNIIMEEYQYETATIRFEDRNGKEQHLNISNINSFYNKALAFQEDKILDNIKSLGYSSDYIGVFKEIKIEVVNPVVMSSYVHKAQSMVLKEHNETNYRNYLSALKSWFDLRDSHGETTIQGAPLYLQLDVNKSIAKNLDENNFVEEVKNLYPDSNIVFNFIFHGDEKSKRSIYIHEGEELDTQTEICSRYFKYNVFDFGAYLLNRYEGYDSEFQTSNLEFTLKTRH